VPALSKAGLTGTHFHDLRHIGNVLTAGTGATLRELMDRMGHTSTRAAMIYMHGADARQREIADTLSKLARQELPCVDPEARIYFRDVSDHIRRVQARVDGLRDVLAGVFEFSSLLEQQRQGTITRQLAAWAAILAVPTAIAGIYGMNFHNMPELSTQYGYYVVVGVIVVICLLLYARFRRTGWL